MAGTTTYFGISYPTSTDLVKDGAANMQTIATGFDSAVAIPNYNNQTGTTYTFALADIPKTVTANNASSQTYTIPTQASVIWPANTTLNIINLGAGTVTIAGAVGVTLTNSSTTLSQYQSAALVRTAENAWTLVPFAGGVSSLSDSAISGTTGTPATATYTSGGINYKTYAFTGSGSITLTKAGLVDLLLVGGGGGAGGYNWGGGGGGGAIIQQQVYLTAGTAGVIVGAGGGVGGRYSQGVSGNPSSVGVGTNVYTYIAIGGGGGAPGDDNVNSKNARSGASGGGGGGVVGGAGGAVMLTALGNIGGNGSSGGLGGGGGGGFVSAGSNATVGNTGGNGGNGTTSTFVNGSTSVAYAGGGGGDGVPSGTAGTGGGNTANRGGGGNGAGGQAGGSGLVVVRVQA